MLIFDLARLLRNLACGAKRGDEARSQVHEDKHRAKTTKPRLLQPHREPFQIRASHTSRRLSDPGAHVAGQAYAS